ncbi:MAG: DUF433 domain-containing protein [Anaerolineae bacterium]|nr:DUF433 domain-containing protein [Anaerolineae bacterium]
MQLEDYFDVNAPDDIRIKGHRIGIESVLYDYLFRERTPEQIAQRYPSLELEQIYATILYYLRNRETINAYMRDWLIWRENARAEQDRNPPPVLIHLREQMADRKNSQPA